MKKTPQKRRKKSKIALNLSAAAARIGQPVMAAKMAKDAGCEAFKPNGRIDLPQLTAWLDRHPEIIEAVKNLPDAKAEKALTLRIDRQRAEVAFERELGSLISVADLTPALLSLGKTIAGRLLLIPDRVGAKYAALNDAQAIREDLNNEIRKALRVLSESAVADLLKEVPVAG